MVKVFQLKRSDALGVVVEEGDEVAVYDIPVVTLERANDCANEFIEVYVSISSPKRFVRVENITILKGSCPSGIWTVEFISDEELLALLTEKGALRLGVASFDASPTGLWEKSPAIQPK